METAAELSIHRANTRAFIDADVKTIVLNRSVRVSNGQGGYETSPPAPRPPQQLRLIPLKGTMAPERVTLEGTKVAPDYILLGMHDDDIARWDEFEDEGRRYQVIFVNEKRTYETKGEVLYLGEV
jgi:hypothetical protein